MDRCFQSFLIGCLWLAPTLGMSFECASSKNISLSYTAGSGLGYSIGYTSLDLFLSQPFACQTCVSFFDLRGHIFNNGRCASNVGIGLRSLTNCVCSSTILGINVFYDFLNTKRGTYNQIGVGLEALGHEWDLLANAYLPIGRTKRDIYRFSYDFFKDNAPIFLLKAKESLAYKGVDVLLRYRLCINGCFDTSFSLGPYFYWGYSATTKNAFRSKFVHAYGGQARARVFFRNLVLLEGIGTYDTHFKWNGQVTFGLNLPFDALFNLAAYWRSGPDDFCCLRRRLYRPPQRTEIITADSIHRFSRDPQVLDPENPPK